MPSKNKLAIYLIKEDFTEYRDIVRCFDEKTEIPEVGTVFVDYSHTSVPSWAESFFVHQIDTTKLFTANARAVALVRILISDTNTEQTELGRIFAITFGYGKNMLKDDVIEERFGMKVVLNTIRPNSLRRINKINIGGNQKLSNEQLPLKSEINDFGLDINRDLVSGITGVSEDDAYVSGTMSGSDLLSVTAEVDITNIIPFLKSTYSKYCMSNYKSSFAWIDQIQETKDSRLIDILNTQLIAEVKASSKNIWMAVPEIIEWSEIKGFKYSGREIFDDIHIDKVRDSFRNTLTNIEQLKSKRIVAVSSLDDSERHVWSAYRCLFGELSIDGKSYCVNSGKWYQIDPDFVSQINADYNQTPISNIEFCGYEAEHKCEHDYSKAFADLHPEEYILMDGRNITYGGGHSSIELCDLLSAQKTLVHIKPYAGSSTLSHLFNQATVSAELIKSDPAFLSLANAKIAEISTNDDYQLLSTDRFNIVFGIISYDEGERPHLPFFSKVSFRYTKQRLLAFGYSVSIKKISREQTAA